jgi:hypothetical protein
MSRETIIKKALVCIDEVSQGADVYPVDKFVDEAIRYVVDYLPLYRLGEGASLDTSSFSVSHGVVSMPLPADFGRLISFKMEDWKRRAEIISEESPRYRQMSNKVLQGNPSRPIVAVCRNKGVLEAYTTKMKDATAEGTYMPYDAEMFSSYMEDVAAWKLAEIVLMAISDVNNAQVCGTRVIELMQ